ncbi:MAG: zinc-binding alcohol dehydrogenase family protein [Deltaproteobacteria bacterium]|nr:zinc-binding alcohol dehydrogenase family protein [Deltaproteobacteria bacterium]MBW2446370.1 zinc-binding alcohol dehydrogenase family protein [Deltaproteobacteria bacterium]
MPTTTRAFSISAPDIEAEKERCGGDLDAFEFSRVLKLDDLELPDPGPGDVRMRILAASAEHNVDHAILADTVNIVESRGGKIYPGNSALGEVLEVGSDVTRFKPGDIVITHCNGDPDEFGFPKRIWAYDTDDSIGWYAEHAVVGEWQLIPAPLDCGLSLWEIAALPLRAPTAYHLWRRAIGIYRLKVSEAQQPKLNVLGFGGGVSELFLMLAKAEGHDAYFCSGSPARRKKLEEQGIVGIDQKAYNRFAEKGDVKAFSNEVKTLTGGVGMHAVCDMLRGPVFPAGFQALARQGVNVSAGWQLSQVLQYNSTIASVKQLTLDHTHYETIPHCAEATKLYGSVFKPTVHDEIYPFADLARCMGEMYENTQTGVPIVRIAEDLPDSVKGIAG